MIQERQRRTQTAEYWLDEFAVGDDDTEFVYEWFMEEGEPRTTDEIALRIMERRCHEEELAISKQTSGQIYQPQQKYEIGQRIAFSALDYTAGQVLGIREGNNPRHGSFRVIQVKLENEDVVREFAAEFSPDHPLQRTTPLLEESTNIVSPKRFYQQYGANVRARVEDALGRNEDFVHFDNRWFLRGLLPEVSTFQLNIAEAILDERRQPLKIQQLMERTSQVLEETGLQTDGKGSARAYALAYALSQDPRFVEIKTPTEPTWYLSNSIPEAVRSKPARLVPMYHAQGGEWLNRELHDFVLELSDEADLLPERQTPSQEAVDSVQVFLIYPHRREGTLPLAGGALALLSERPAERFLVTFLDQRTKERAVGWMMPSDGYAWGLGDWYRRHELPIGSVIELRRSHEPLTFVVGYEERKRKSDWIREARVLGDRLVFGIQRKAYDCRYDRHLLIDEGSVAQLDRLWTNSGAEAESLFDHLTRIFPELAKLSGQGLVHAKTLYSAANLTRRCGAVPIFAELTRRACFDPVGDGNWVYDESLRNVTYMTPREMSERPSSRRQDRIAHRVHAYGTNINEVSTP